MFFGWCVGGGGGGGNRGYKRALRVITDMKLLLSIKSKLFYSMFAAQNFAIIPDFLLTISSSELD